eukprot:CAMPEP_0176278780 /NCGR_PEP_ID=MMETSP0121_2-20121125/48955_1 /TAXON_ID=160619 /ORGANISM="Kryptoperidinium foliaceum, Strain CCMP 1326" /LENGTH=79 /DNA_ID=CAMNT_0017619093 /DNA_START=38 /DNA_END=276 /DNA_ORIENTATION=+
MKRTENGTACLARSETLDAEPAEGARESLLTSPESRRSSKQAASSCSSARLAMIPSAKLTSPHSDIGQVAYRLSSVHIA